MTVLEKFVAFAQGLPAERRRDIEDLLTQIMGNEDEADFTPEELAELNRRVADPNPQYADLADVEAFFARYRTR